MSDNNAADKDIIYLSCRGGSNFTLEGIVRFIRNGDEECIESLAHTIRSCMAARHMLLHVQAVTELNRRCRLIRTRLRELEVSVDSDLEALFERLDQYATTELRKQLN